METSRVEEAPQISQHIHIHLPAQVTREQENPTPVKEKKKKSQSQVARNFQNSLLPPTFVPNTIPGMGKTSCATLSQIYPNPRAMVIDFLALGSEEAFRNKLIVAKIRPDLAAEVASAFQAKYSNIF